MTQNNSDITQCRVSAKGNEILARLQNENIVKAEIDGYRFAISLAIERGFNPVTHTLQGASNKYHVGGVDPDSLLKDIVKILYPEQADQPYRCIEKLADMGLTYIEDTWESTGNLFISEFLTSH